MSEVDELRALITRKRKKPYQSVLATGGYATGGGDVVQLQKFLGSSISKKKTRGTLDPFRDREYYDLDRLYNTLTIDIKQRYTERENVTDEFERAKRGRVIDATKDYRSMVRGLQNTKRDRLQLDFTISSGEVAPDKAEDAERLQFGLADREDTLRTYMDNAKRKAELLEQVPIPGRGEISDTVLDELRDVLQQSRRMNLEQSVMANLEGESQLVTRKEIPELQRKGIEESVSDLALLSAQAANISGAKTPEQVVELLGKEPREFKEKSWWDNRYNPIRQGINAADSLAQIVGGGISAVSGTTGARAWNLMRLGMGDPYAIYPAIKGETEGTPAKIREKFLEDEPWAGKWSGIPVLGNVGAGVEGAVRGINDPWEQKSGFTSLVDQMSMQPGIEGKLLREHPNLKIATDLAYQVGLDPLNIIAAPGKFTKLGKATENVSLLVREADRMNVMGDAAGAVKSLSKAQDLANTAGLTGDIRQIGKAATMPERIMEGQQVLLGFRKGKHGQYAARELPDFLKKVEAAVATPFSKLMGGTKKLPGMEKFSRAFSAKPMMKAPTLAASEELRDLGRMAKGTTMMAADEAAPIFKELNPQSLWRTLNAVVDEAPQTLDDVERAAYDLFTRNVGDMAGKDLAAGLIEDIRKGYATGEYGVTGAKRGVRNITRDILHPGEVGPPTRTYTMTAFDDEALEAVVGAPGFQRMKVRGDEAFVTGRFAPPKGKPTPVPFETPTHAQMYPALEKSLTPVQSLGKYGPVYETNLFDIMMNRMAISESKGATNAFRRLMVEKFGLSKKVADDLGTTTEYLRKSGEYVPMDYTKGKRLKEPLPNYGTNRLREALKAEFPDVSGKEIRDIIGDRTASRQFGELLDLDPVGHQMSRTLHAEADIPREIDALFQSQLPSAGKGAEGVDALLKHTVDPLTNLFKVQATAWRTGFHGRNWLSNQYLMHLAGVPLFDMNLRKQARRIKRGKNLGDDVLHLYGKDVGRMQDLHGMALKGDALTSGIHGENALDMRQLTQAAEPWTTGLKHSLKKTAGLHVTDPNFLLTKYGKKLGSNIENQARMMTFLDDMAKTGISPHAANATAKFMIDYSDLSRFERNFLRRVIPFYSWGRHNIPLQISQAVQQPEKFMRVKRMLESLREAGVDKWGEEQVKKTEKFLPDYFKDILATLTPGSWKGDPLYFNPNFPFQDLTKLGEIPDLLMGNLGEANDFLFSLNPLIKMTAAKLSGSASRQMGIPKEYENTAPWFAKYIASPLSKLGIGGEPRLATDKYSGQPVWQVPGGTAWAASQSPWLNDIIQTTRTDRTDIPLQALSRLGGVKFMPFDWERQYMRQTKEKRYELRDIMDELKDANVYDLDTEKYKMPELAKPPSSITLYKFMQEMGISITPAGYNRAVQLYKGTKGAMSPMNWPTFKDVKNVNKRWMRILVKMPRDQYRAGRLPSYEEAPVPIYGQEPYFAGGGGIPESEVEKLRRLLGL